MRDVTRFPVAAFLAGFLSAGSAAAATCEGLAGVKLRDVSVTRAESVPAGGFSMPPGVSATVGDGPMLRELRAFCRVAATLTPSADSHIEMELWLPIDDWNGKFLAVGNGGWAGRISYTPAGLSLIDGVRRGYATASTDTGHKGQGDPRFAIGHREKLIDHGYRAVHEMTVASKALVAEFYGRPSRLSYWNGCSTGGRQGLMEAQRFPADFDGIVAGAPANNITNMHAWDLFASVPALTNRAGLLPQAKLTLLNNAVLASCDGKDGVKDGFLNDPRACRYDPSVIACRGADADDCLTAPQLETVTRMYSPARTVAGREIYPGKERGSEANWSPVASTAQQPVAVALGSFQIAYSSADWDWRSFNLDRDLTVTDERLGPILNALNPDLSAFKARGGKLILYHGWNDTLIPPRNTVNYYSSVLDRMGSSQQDWIRLFMAPGMNHCSGGVGPDRADFLGALEQWREGNHPPDRIVATRQNQQEGSTLRRPLCPYPQVAHYTGTGSVNDDASFVCRDN